MFIVVYCIILQEIDAILVGGLTQEDETDVLNELDQILMVTFNLFFEIHVYQYSVVDCQWHDKIRSLSGLNVDK